MHATESEDLRFPVGRHTPVDRFDRRVVDEGIAAIEAFPGRLRALLAGTDEASLEKTYRPKGWTARQVVHHLADSHTHIYIRFKWTLTEDTPTIKAYDEAGWAELPDYRGPVEPALRMLEAIHARWTALMRTMDDVAFQKRFHHPETGGYMTLFDRVACYAWHGRHHLAHIRLALEG